MVEVRQGDFKFDFASGAVTGPARREFLDPTISGEGTKVILSNGNEVSIRPSPVKPNIPDWSEYKTTLDITQDEWDEISLKVKIIGEIINARETQSITQQNLGKLSGVHQPIIARLERNNTDPRLTTLLKILRPLGKTLAVVPIEIN